MNWTILIIISSIVLITTFFIAYTEINGIESAKEISESQNKINFNEIERVEARENRNLFNDTNIEINNQKFIIRNRDVEINMTVYLNVSGERIDLNNTKWQYEKRAGRFKFATNITIPNNTVADGLTQIIYSIKSNGRMRNNEDGFTVKIQNEENSLESYVLKFNYTDILNSFPSMELSTEQIGNEILIKINTSSFIFSAGELIFLDPDIIVAGDAHDLLNRRQGPRNVVWINSTKGYVFYHDTNVDSMFVMTNDSGNTWSGGLSVSGEADNIVKMEVWYDKWTTGQNGDLIHIAWMDTAGDDVLYTTLNITNDFLPPDPIVVFAGSVIDSGNNILSDLSITKSRNGILYIAARLNDGNPEASEVVFAQSYNMTTWTARADVWEGAAGDDSIKLIYGNSSDPSDIYAIYDDASANQLSLKVYDNSSDSWTGTTETIIGTHVEISTAYDFDVVPRHSDNHSILSFWDDGASVFGNLSIWDIGDNNTIIKKTDIIQSVNGAADLISLMVNQQNDDLYASYSNGTTSTTSLFTVYKKSTDGGGTWGNELMLSSYLGDVSGIYGAASVGNSGGRFMPVWFNTTSNVLLTNFSNSITINAVVAGDTTPPSVASLTEAPSDPTTYSLGKRYEFNATITDAGGLQSIRFQFNGTNYSATNLFGDNYNFSITNLGGGVYSYLWWANDTSGNVNRTETGTYTINQAAGNVSIFLNHSQSNLTIINNTSIDINGTLNNGAGLIELWKNGSLINIKTSPIYNLTLFNGAFGSYNMTILYRGNENFTTAFSTLFINVTNNITLDTTFPLINFTNPTERNNTTINRSNILVNVTASDVNLANITVMLSNATNILNTTVSGDYVGSSFNGTDLGFLVSLTSATHTILIDDAMKSANLTVVFSGFTLGTLNVTVNNKLVGTITTTDTSPITFSNIQSNLTIGINNITYTPLVASTATIDSSNISFITAPVSPLFLNFTPLTNGTYFINASAVDTSNNINYTETRTVIINTTITETDTTPPSVASLTEAPSDPTTYSLGKRYEFNATITDAGGLQSIRFQFNGTNYSASNLFGDNYNASITNLGGGVYNYLWWANDTSGNVNRTETGSYTISQDNGNISLLLNNSASNLTIFYPSQVNASAFSLSGQTVLLFRNGTPINSSNGLFFDLPAGLYNFTAQATANENYSFSTISRFADIQKGTPPLTLSFSPAQTITNGTQSIVTGLGCPSQTLCNLFRDNVNVSNPDIQNLSVGMYMYLFNTTGNSNYTFFSVSGNLVVQNVQVASNIVAVNCPSDFIGYYNRRLPHILPAGCEQ